MVRQHAGNFMSTFGACALFFAIPPMMKSQLCFYQTVCHSAESIPRHT